MAHFFIQPLSLQAGTASHFILAPGRAPPPCTGVAGRAALPLGAHSLSASQHQPARPQTPAHAAPFHFSTAHVISKGKIGSFESKAFSSTHISTEKESFMEVTIAVCYQRHRFLLKFTCYA